MLVATHMAKDLNEVDVHSLPSNIRAMVEGLSTDLRGQLFATIAKRRTEGRRRHRAEIEEQAGVAANMVCNIYFQSLKDSNAYCDPRLSRKYRDRMEKAHSEHQRKHVHGLAGSIKSLGDWTTTIKQSAENAIFHYAPRHHRLSIGDDQAPDVPDMSQYTPVHTSVAATLELMGVENHRLDCTKHDGVRYWDVVAELPQQSNEHGGMRVRGLVIQILPNNHRHRYVGIKTEALRADAWAVITVEPLEWGRMATKHEQLQWLARALVKSGFWRHGDSVKLVVESGVS